MFFRVVALVLLGMVAFISGALATILFMPTPIIEWLSL